MDFLDEKLKELQSKELLFRNDVLKNVFRKKEFWLLKKSLSEKQLEQKQEPTLRETKSFQL